MTTGIALFRAINVGGKNMVAMAALREMFATLKLPDAKSLLQSGNVVFGIGSKDAEKLEGLIEKEIARRFAFDADCFIRSAEEWRDILAHNPFTLEAKEDPGRLIVMALKAAPTPTQLGTLRVAIKGRETVELWKRHAYVYFPDGSGNSKLTPRLIESKLETRATGRNWNTALKLQAMVG